MGIMQRVVREDGTIYRNGYNSRIKKCGVRPAVLVDMATLVALGKK
jgi:hypothetical protein